MEPWSASAAAPPAPIRVPSQCVTCPLVSRQSCMSANNKGDNKVKPGAGHRSPEIYLRKAPEKFWYETVS